jgi:formate-dependent nitrite reductase cytochrome c552 subunit
VGANDERSSTAAASPSTQTRHLAQLPGFEETVQVVDMTQTLNPQPVTHNLHPEEEVFTPGVGVRDFAQKNESSAPVWGCPAAWILPSSL